MRNHMTRNVFRNSKILHFLGVKSETYQIMWSGDKHASQKMFSRYWISIDRLLLPKNFIISPYLPFMSHKILLIIFWEYFKCFCFSWGTFLTFFESSLFTLSCFLLSNSERDNSFLTWVSDRRSAIVGGAKQYFRQLLEIFRGIDLHRTFEFIQTKSTFVILFPPTRSFLIEITPKS